MREESDNQVRVEANGDIRIPKALLVRLLRVANNRDPAGLNEDMADFSPGRIVRIGLSSCDSGTEFTIERDRRKEARDVPTSRSERQ
jgi:hypothetical protein